MGPDLGIMELMHWVTYFFPSLGQYTKILMPLAMLVFSCIGVFSNILPEPGSIYQVPSVADIDAELKGKGWFVHRLTRLARWLTVGINHVVRSLPYKWFYLTTRFCASIVDRLKGGTGKTDDEVGISEPKPYKLNFSWRKADRNKDKHDE